MMFLVGEYLHMVAAAYLIVMLFFGGWHFWGLTGADGLNVTWVEAILRVVVLHVKVLGVIFFFMLARWAWARFRYDQLMSLAWLGMLPLGMLNLAYIAVWQEYGEAFAGRTGFSSPVLMAIGGWIVLLVAWFAATTMSGGAATIVPASAKTKGGTGSPSTQAHPNRK